MSKRYWTWLLLGGMAMASPAAFGQQAGQPPVPAPAIPPPPPPPPPSGEAAPATPTAPGTESAPAPAPANGETAAAQEGPKATITLGDKTDTITPGKIHDGLDEGGKITVEVSKEGDKLTALLSGVAAAHTFVGAHSVSVQSFKLVQEFDVTSTDTGVTSVVLTLEAALNGYVRSIHKGQGCMKLACASLAPVGGSPLATVAFAPRCVCGDDQCLYKREEKPAPTPPLPLGRYVLTATFYLEASAEGLLNGRGIANFSADGLPDPWKLSKDPFKDTDAKDFGFALTVTATVPGATGQARRKAPRVGVRPANRPAATRAAGPIPMASRAR
ncbi:MAG TPA: hypothetical protein VG406_22435 [Isosphaeraceae bacterium]|jgi:hypothetical protein|nr:hypothetical protein [Isosphaeraceae bacterium]